MCVFLRVLKMHMRGSTTITSLYMLSLSEVIMSAEPEQEPPSKKSRTGAEDGNEKELRIWTSGFDTGKLRGFDQGKLRGLSQGYQEGYTEGFWDGKAEGRREIFDFYEKGKGKGTDGHFDDGKDIGAKGKSKGKHGKGGRSADHDSSSDDYDHEEYEYDARGIKITMTE